MRIIRTRNVHTALVEGVSLLNAEGVRRGSRNGAVRVAPWPVVTEYHHPWEKVGFWPQRDTNIAFLIYEAFWMLLGRNDIEPLTRYIKGFGRYSDDGKTQHGAYGHRWRERFGFDQLPVIIDNLQTNMEDRRCVLTMFQAGIDLVGAKRIGCPPTKDVPCNIAATLQRDENGRLDLTVFNRSNDIIWGAYFANAFHFGCLLEYLAAYIDCPVGIYRQISVNYHAYDETFDPLLASMEGNFAADPYADSVNAAKLNDVPPETLHQNITYVVGSADAGFVMEHTVKLDPVMQAAYNVLKAHHLWRTLAAPERFDRSLDALYDYSRGEFGNLDWITSMHQWLKNRREVWEKTLAHHADRQ